MRRETLQAVIALLAITASLTSFIDLLIRFMYLTSLLGDTFFVHSLFVVLAFGGLIIGMLIGGNSSARAGRPLTFFGIFSLLSASIAAIYPFLHPFIARAFTTLGQGFATGGLGIMAVKSAFMALTLLPMAVLTGLAISCLAAAFIRIIEDSERSASLFCFLLAFGGIPGIALAGLVAIPTAGLIFTCFASSGLAIVSAIVAIIISSSAQRSMPEATGEPAISNAGISRISLTFMPKIVTFLTAATATIAGFALSRILINGGGPSSAQSPLFYMGCFSGIAAGIWVTSVVISRSESTGFRLLLFAHSTLTLSLLVMTPFLGRMWFTSWHLRSVLQPSAGYFWYLFLYQITVGAILLIPSFAVGMVLAMCIRLAFKEILSAGRSIGIILSSSLSGSAIGFAVCSLLLLPIFGINGTFEVSLALCFVVLAIVTSTSFPGSRRVKLAWIIGAVTVIVGYLFLRQGWKDPSSVARMFHQMGSKEPDISYATFISPFESMDVRFMNHDIAAAGVVIGGAFNEALSIDGTLITSLQRDLAPRVLATHVPMLLHPNPASIALIGHGSAIAIPSILTHSPAMVECVEPSTGIIEAYGQLTMFGGTTMSDERVSISTEDPSVFLRLTERRFDIIALSALNERLTSEFLQLVKGGLNSEGFFVLTMDLREQDMYVFTLALRTVLSEFPRVSLWQSSSSSVFLIASESSTEPDFSAIERRFQRTSVRFDLDRIGLHDLPTLFSLQMAGEDHINEIPGYGVVNTENIPHFEIASAKAFVAGRTFEFGEDIDSRLNGGDVSDLIFNSYRARRTLHSREVLQIGEYHARPGMGSLSLGRYCIAEYCAQVPSDTEGRRSLARVCEALGRHEEALAHYKEILLVNPDDIDALEHVASITHSTEMLTSSTLLPRENLASLAPINRCIELSADTVDRFRTIRGDIHFSAGRYADALTDYQRSLVVRSQYPSNLSPPVDRLLLQLARTCIRLGQNDKALGYLIQASIANPRNKRARELLVDLYMKGTNIQP